MSPPPGSSSIHVATQHAVVASRTFERLGRMALGLPTDASGL